MAQFCANCGHEYDDTTSGAGTVGERRCPDCGSDQVSARVYPYASSALSRRAGYKDATPRGLAAGWPELIYTSTFSTESDEAAGHRLSPLSGHTAVFAVNDNAVVGM